MDNGNLISYFQALTGHNQGLGRIFSPKIQHCTTGSINYWLWLETGSLNHGTSRLIYSRKCHLRGILNSQQLDYKGLNINTSAWENKYRNRQRMNGILSCPVCPLTASHGVDRWEILQKSSDLHTNAAGFVILQAIPVMLKEDG